MSKVFYEYLQSRDNYDYRTHRSKNEVILIESKGTV